MTEVKITHKEAQNEIPTVPSLYKDPLVAKLDKKWANSRDMHAIILVSQIIPESGQRSPDDPRCWLMKKIPDGELMFVSNEMKNGEEIQLDHYPETSLADHVANWVKMHGKEKDDYAAVTDEDINPGIRTEVMELLQK